MNNISSTPLVTIITPAYNAGLYIEDTIKSVLSQSFCNWQWFIINDGSQDNTELLISNYLTDTRIHYFKHVNCGVAATRNKGIKMVNTRYISFLDADDIWLPNNLQEKIELLEKEEDIYWVYSNMYEFFTADKTIKEANEGTDKDITNSILQWERDVVPGPCSNIIMRSSCFNSNILFDKTLSTAADQDFCLQLSSLFRGKLLPAYLWYYRILTTSMSRNIKVMEKDHINVFKKASRNKLFKSKLFKYKCFSNLYLILGGSWWVNGNNKIRGVYFIILAIVYYPPVIFKLLKKLAK